MCVRVGGRVLTGSVLLQLPEGPQQSLVALLALIILSVQQDLFGIEEQTGDSDDPQRDNRQHDYVDMSLNIIATEITHS